VKGSFDESLLKDACRLGAATVHEAAGKIGALPSTVKPVDPSWRIAGPATTVRSPAGDNLALLRAIGRAEAGAILVVATGDAHPEWGYWGEIMSTAARVAGLEGLVLQGGSRDHAMLPDIGFPVFSLGACIRGTSKRPAPEGAGIDVAIEIGGVAIRPGDLIVGDIDGVVAIPGPDAREIIVAGLRRHEAEVTMLQQLRAGETNLNMLGLDRSRASA
jgi:4-hydroxy-4-methyl-2-oxoglutarate aldolase